MCNDLCAFVTVGLRARIHLAHAPQFCVERLKTRLASNKGGAWTVDHIEPILTAAWDRIQELTSDAHKSTETTRVAAFDEEVWKEGAARFVKRWWKSSKVKAMRKEAGCAPVRGGGASKKKKRRGAASASTSGGGGGPFVEGQRALQQSSPSVARQRINPQRCSQTSGRRRLKQRARRRPPQWRPRRCEV